MRVVRQSNRSQLNRRKMKYAAKILTFVQYYSSFTFLFQLSSSESVKTPEPFFGEVPSVKERASTMPVIPSAESAVTENSAHQPPTQLRVHTNSTRDPNWRKSGTVVFSSPLLLQILNFEPVALSLHSSSA